MFFLFIIVLGGTVMAQNNPVTKRGTLVKQIESLRDFRAPDDATLVKVFDDNGNRIWPAGIARPHYEYPVRPVDASYTDPLVQRNVATSPNGNLTTDAVLLGIEGLATGVNPMDPTICVGNNHVIELVNAAPSTRMKIWNKDGSVAVNEVLLQTLTGFPGYGDPIALYDQFSDRYIVTEFLIKGLNGSTEHGMVIMVSKTGDPTAGWNIYKWTIPEAFILDYPKWAVNTDGIYLHTNNFNDATSAYTSSYFAVFNKDDMYAGNTTFRSIRITQSIGNGYATCAAQVQGGTSPSGGQLFITENNSNTATVIALNTNWTSNTLTQSTAATITLSAFNETVCSASRGACATQPSPGSAVEVLSFRIMNQPIVRVVPGYTGLVFCFTVNAGANTAGIRWVELKNTGSGWTLNQESTWHPNSNHQFMPSMAYDANGNIGLAYSTSSSSTFLSIRYTARKACDPLGQMTLAETSLREGNAVSSGTRWGDYNHLIADPNGQSLWMVSMYGRSGASGGKGSYISRFDLESCGPVSCAAPTGLTSSSVTTSSATVSWTAVSGANNYTVEYKTTAATTWTTAAAAAT
ncbi:MAG: hypothetical protein JNM68_09290, partial [Dinghuibacter sp.]|nr:hypothetical protein [Dinghuibacter sp.]